MGATTILTVDISDTVGQSALIAVNGGDPVFRIRVTQSHERVGFGFGVALEGPCAGHEVFYKASSVKVAGAVK